MNDSIEATQENQPSWSYSPPLQQRPQGIMKSTPRLNKIVDKIWNQQDHESTALDNSSADNFPIQPPIRQIEVVYLDTTTSENNTNADAPIVELTEDTPAEHPDVPMVELPEDTASPNAELPKVESPKEVQEDPLVHDEEHKSPATSPAKNSISSIHPSDFYNQDEF